jgi:hypothetical protein
MKNFLKFGKTLKTKAELWFFLGKIDHSEKLKILAFFNQ